MQLLQLIRLVQPMQLVQLIQLIQLVQPIQLDRCLRHRGGEPDQAPEFHAGAYFV